MDRRASEVDRMPYAFDRDLVWYGDSYVTSFGREGDFD